MRRVTGTKPLQVQNAVFGEGEDCSVGVFPIKVSFVLKALGGGKQGRVDRHRADRRRNVSTKMRQPDREIRLAQ